MKTNFHLLAVSIATVALLGLALPSASQAQTTAVTTPVGYQTVTLYPGFNVVGLNLVEKVLASGALEAGAANTVVDQDASFVTATQGVTATNLIVEITSGTGAGYNTSVTVVSSATQLTTVDNLYAVAAAGDTYVVRSAKTIAGIFGLNNEAGLLAGTSGTADLIWIPKGGGEYNKYFYNSSVATPQWRRIGGGAINQSNAPVYSTDGLLIEKKGAGSLNLVVAGHVVTKTRAAYVETGYNLIDSAYPVGATLGNSGLYDPTAVAGQTLTPGTSGTADLVWIQRTDGSGAYDKYFFNNAVATPQWRRIGGGGTIQNDVSLAPGILIERKSGGAFNMKLKPDPAIYGNL